MCGLSSIAMNLRTVLLLPLLVWVWPTLAQDTVTQDISLDAGWNAVWLDVDPTDRSPAAVFAGLPVEQVWCYFPTERPVEFINDPTSPEFNREGWNVFIPTGEESVLSDLHAIQPCRPYLIKATSAATWTVTGSPAFKPFNWKPQSFNLVGFPLNPTSGGGTVGAFFLSDPSLREGKKFRLTSAGRWVEMAPFDTVNSGEAYWIFADTASDFNGQIGVDLGGGRSLDFNLEGTRVNFTLRNPTSWPLTVTLSNPNALPLSWREVNTLGSIDWLPLSSLTLPAIPAEGSLLIHLGLNRTDLAADFDSHIVVSGAGSQIEIPITAAVPSIPVASGGFAGLWVGDVVLDQVAEVNADPNTLKDTPAEFRHRLILHVDGTGQTSLLKQVIQVWKDGERAPDGSVASPGSFVLLTDDSLIPLFKGAELRDGAAFGHRISSPAYDFPEQELPLTGTFGVADQTLTGTIFIDKFSPTHPYRHRYHPDHDGLTPEFDGPLQGRNSVDPEAIRTLAGSGRDAEIDAWIGGGALPEDIVTLYANQFANGTPTLLRELNDWGPTEFAVPGQVIIVPLTADKEELWDITRAITLVFSPVDTSNPSTSTGLVQGSYQETVTGMHRAPIRAGGRFELRRATTLSELNPQP